MYAKIINQGIDFLSKEQQKDGGFLGLSSSESDNFIPAKRYQTTFPASLILSCLNNLEETAQAQKIKQKAAEFLLSQKNRHWSLNYFVRNSKDARRLPFPDDLDDTFCALSALFQYNPKLIDALAMAKIVMLLTATEEKEGGPYCTWLVPSSANKDWKDVDLAVNSNVAYFLFLQDISLPHLNSFIESAIENNNYYSPNYPPGYPVIYFISRFYKGDKTKKIIKFLLEKQDKDYKWNNPLNTALAISALLNFGFKQDKLGKSILYLISNQKQGAWKPYVFNIDPALKGKTHYAGSPALTTAFCLEALQKYLTLSQSKQTQQIEPKKAEKTKKQIEIYNSIIRIAKQKCLSFSADLKKQALVQLAQTLKTDKDKQIVLLPCFFKMALAKNSENISDEKLIQLGLANLYGWIAYTIYDDFLDDEGEPKLLSVANAMLRNLTTIFNNILPPETGFPALFHKIMDALDAANTWEANNCRINKAGSRLEVPDILPDYKDYTKIAERSLGHMLGPIAILFLLGYTQESLEVKNLMSFFKHYLTARQLNDDAHDWEQDIKKGHINSVGAAVLKKWKETVPFSEQQKTNILKIMPDLQKIFWRQIMPTICQNVLKQTNLAEKSLLAIPIITKPLTMQNFLKPVKYATEKALAEQAKAIQFLKAYHQ